MVLLFDNLYGVEICWMICVVRIEYVCIVVLLIVMMNLLLLM